MTPLLSLRGTMVPKQSPGMGMRLPHPDKSGLAMTKKEGARNSCEGRDSFTPQWFITPPPAKEFPPAKAWRAGVRPACAKASAKASGQD